MTEDPVRLRAGMYVGDTRDGSGLVTLVLEIVANALDQWLAGRCTRIAVHIGSDGTITVEDDGPGLRAHGGDGMPPLATLLEEISTRPTVDGHRPHVHLGLGGLGLAVVQRLCDRFELVSVRDGEVARVSYARGTATAPLSLESSTEPNGTRVRFHPDAEIFHGARVSATEVARRLDELSFLAPGLRLSWSADADATAAHGVAGLVACRLLAPLTGIAHERGTYETDGGPVEVEVALAWSDPPAGNAVIESFVNLGRTRGAGTHVAGLRDGVRRFLPANNRERGLVAAVNVVLADVILGNPTKDRLDSPHARPAVANATEAALRRWAAEHPAATERLREQLE